MIPDRLLLIAALLFPIFLLQDMKTGLYGMMMPGTFGLLAGMGLVRLQTYGLLTALLSNGRWCQEALQLISPVSMVCRELPARLLIPLHASELPDGKMT